MSIVRGPQRCSLARSRPKVALDRLRALKQRVRRQARRDRDAEIDEGRLVGHAPGRRAVVGRARDAAAPRRRRRTSRRRGRASRARRRHCRRARSGPQPLSTRRARSMRHADIVEDRGDRRMRLVHRDAHALDLGKLREHRVGDRAGGGLDQPVALRARTPRSPISTIAGRRRRCRRACRSARRRRRSMVERRSITKRWPTLASCSITP